MFYPIVISSTGFRIGASCLCPFNESANVRLPILPQNIRNTSTILDAIHTSLVIPADIPTVPIAEKTSNITSDKENGCIISMKIVPVSIRNKFVHITTLAFLIAVSSSLLLNTLQPAASIRFARTNTIRTTTRAILDLAARHDGQTVAVVSHGMAIRAYLCTVLGIPNSEMSTLPYGDNTSVSLLLVDGERTTVEYYNDNRHLPPALSTFGRQTWWRGSGSGAENLRYEQLTFPHDEAFYLQCYRDAWCNVHGSDEGFVPELYARSAAKHAQEHPGSVVRVLSGDTVVGLVELDPARDEQTGCGWISLLYMLPEYRGRGWAIQLLGYAFWFYENHDRNTVRLHVSENNARAIAFYRRSGFVQLGRDPGVRERLLLMGRLIHRTVTHGSV